MGKYTRRRRLRRRHSVMRKIVRRSLFEQLIQKEYQILKYKAQLSSCKLELQETERSCEYQEKITKQEIQKMKLKIHECVEQIRLIDQAKKLSIRKDKKRRAHLIGNISTGKSELLNKLFDLTLPVGIGDTTSKISIVAQNLTTEILDYPGFRGQFNFANIRNLNLIDPQDIILILYTTSLTEVKPAIQMIKTLQLKNIFLIRTKCDFFEENIDSNQKSLEQELEEDRKYLEHIGAEYPILKTSARKGIQYQDNQEVKDLLEGHQ